MFNVIVAVSKPKCPKCASNTRNATYGIGKYVRSIPTMAWHCPDELKLFKEKTMGNVLIMGRKTVENLPCLKNREIYCISRNDSLYTSGWKNPNVPVFKDVMCAVLDAQKNHPDKTIFVAGGAAIYNHVFTNYQHLIKEVHISYMKEEYQCDIFFHGERYLNQGYTTLVDVVEHPEFRHEVVVLKYSDEMEYLRLLQFVSRGETREGRNGKTRSLFFPQPLKFDLRDGFPLLTTKKMFFRGIVEELLFFIRGDTDSKLLEEKNVNIWKGNTSREFLDSIGKTEYKEGLMGPMYGYQWRNLNAEYDTETGRAKPESRGVDQLQKVVEQLRTDPFSRRILLTDYNPAQADEGCLYPCHSCLIQFYVSERTHLDMYVHNRSQDLFLGTPFNIASSALLLTLIAHITEYKPRFLHISMGDAHLYEQHLEVAEEQWKRHPYVFPKLKILKETHELKDIENLTWEDFELGGYRSHPTLKAEMVP